MINNTPERSETLQHIRWDVGMNHKVYFVLCIVATLFISLLLLSTTADENIDVTVGMIDGTSQTRFTNMVMVAGIWHDIMINVHEDVTSLTIVLYLGDIIPSESERTTKNYYAWGYNATFDPVWYSEIFYQNRTYLNVLHCEKNENEFRFNVGVADTFPNEIFYHENWTLYIEADSQKIFSGTLVIEKPTVALSRTHADHVNVNVDPFSQMNGEGDDYFSVGNTGNIPLHLLFSYGVLDEYITVSGDTMISPGATSLYYLMVTSPSWKPGYLTDSGIVEGKIDESLLIGTDATITFSSSIQIDAPVLTIFVGHANHEIIFVNTDLSFQYENSVTIHEGETREIFAYISGDAIVTLDVWTDEDEKPRDRRNISIQKIIYNENEISPPFSVSSTVDDEQNIMIFVEAIKENTEGIIEYTIDVEGKDPQLFQTRISVGAPLSDSVDGVEISSSMYTYIIILLVLLVIVYLVFTQLRNRRR